MGNTSRGRTAVLKDAPIPDEATSSVDTMTEVVNKVVSTALPVLSAARLSASQPRRTLPFLCKHEGDALASAVSQ